MIKKRILENNVYHIVLGILIIFASIFLFIVVTIHNFNHIFFVDNDFIVFNGIILIIWVAGCRLSYVSLIKIRKPETHPFMKSLRRLEKYGDPESIIEQIESQLREIGITNLNPTSTITKSWVVKTPANAFFISVMNIKITHIHDIVWVHLLSKSNEFYGIPTTTDHGLMLYDNTGNKFDLFLKDEETAKAQANYILSQNLWCIVGYNKELKTLWNTDKFNLIQRVMAKRNNLIGVKL